MTTMTWIDDVRRCTCPLGVKDCTCPVHGREVRAALAAERAKAADLVLCATCGDADVDGKYINGVEGPRCQTCNGWRNVINGLDPAREPLVPVEFAKPPVAVRALTVTGENCSLPPGKYDIETDADGNLRVIGELPIGRARGDLEIDADGDLKTVAPHTRYTAPDPSDLVTSNLNRRKAEGRRTIRDTDVIEKVAANADVATGNELSTIGAIMVGIDRAYGETDASFRERLLRELSPVKPLVPPIPPEFVRPDGAWIDDLRNFSFGDGLSDQVDAVVYGSRYGVVLGNAMMAGAPKRDGSIFDHVTGCRYTAERWSNRVKAELKHREYENGSKVQPDYPDENWPHARPGDGDER